MPKVVDHAQRRSGIALALWQVIYEQGIEAVSFRSVAQAAGVSIGRVQHYFAGKDELVLHGCRQMVEAAVQDHGQPRAATDPSAARAGLLELLCAALSEDEEFRMGASVWAAYQAKAMSDPDIAAVVTEAMIGRTAALAELLVAARAAAPGRTPSPAATDRTDALRLATLSEGCAQRVLVGAMTADEARDLVRTTVEECLTTEHAGRAPAG